MSAPRQDAGGWLADTPKPVRIVTYVGLILLGAVVGTAGALVQGGLFPGGLLLALFATTGLFFGGLRLTGTQVGVGAPALGWLAAVILLSMGRAEGDGVLAAGAGPLLYLFGGTLIAVMCATMSRLPQPDAKSGRLGK
ncbi:DUF6113 family protein [Streptomyces sp. NPDC088725]|uniref:DUF6113 family protein n=1 Tax=Streptomyces sp. NPDC088725 TaxID=3365873 RepID=UPI0037F44F5B